MFLFVWSLVSLVPFCYLFFFFFVYNSVLWSWRSMFHILFYCIYCQEHMNPTECGGGAYNCDIKRLCQPLSSKLHKHTRAGTINRLIDWFEILLIIDYTCMSLIPIMLIMYNMEVTRSLFDDQMGGVSCINWLLFDLITSADFNRLSIDLKLLIIDFRISADSQP